MVTCLTDKFVGWTTLRGALWGGLVCAECWSCPQEAMQETVGIHLRQVGLVPLQRGMHLHPWRARQHARAFWVQLTQHGEHAYSDHRAQACFTPQCYFYSDGIDSIK